MMDIVTRQIVNTAATFRLIKPPIHLRTSRLWSAATATSAEGASERLKVPDCPRINKFFRFEVHRMMPKFKRFRHQHTILLRRTDERFRLRSG